MLTVIRKPNIGERIRSEEVKITGRVVDLYDYDYVYSTYTKEEFLAVNKVLSKELGDDFRDKYFQAVVKVTYAKKGSEYKKGDLAVLVWDEYQRCKVLPKKGKKQDDKSTIKTA